MRSGHLLSSVLMLSLFFLLPTWGDVPDAPPLGACYMGYGKTLESAQSRQLTLRENAYQFSYQPGGLEIACVGEQREGDAVTRTVRLVGVRHGAMATLMSDTFHVGVDGSAVEPGQATTPILGGWSGNGRYLMVEQDRFLPAEPPAGQDDFRIVRQYTLVDVGAEPVHLATIPLPDSGRASPVFWWSPTRTRLLFVAQDLVGDRPNRYVADTFCCVYDLAQNRLTSVELSDAQFAVGWIDDTHLMLKRTKGGSKRFFNQDVKTGVQIEIPVPARLPTGLNDADPPSTASLTSPKAAYLSLQDEPRLLTDPQQVTSQHAHALWVRRIQGPKRQSALPVGLSPGRDDPQARWSPTGTQIAFIAHGDLFVTDLTMRDATAAEKYAAGEKLDCAEERDLAASNLKQIGLALLEYNQDFDEQFPPADHWQDSVKPYIGPDILLSIGGHPVVYHTPANLSLASIDSAADTILGEIDLPCATVTLYVDGHVKSLPKATNQARP